MEFMKTGLRCLLRALLTLALLYGLNCRTAARSTAAPKDIDINTIVDDEDVEILVNQRREGVQFVLELLSKVGRDWCDETSKGDVVIKQIRTHLLNDLSEECKCIQTSDTIISQEKLECQTSKTNVHYSGEILRWTSSVYPIHQLAQFIDSWRPFIIIEGADVNFDTVPNFQFTFNVTNSQTIMVSEDIGSGWGANIDNITEELGSGDEMVVIDEANSTDRNPGQNKTFNTLTDGTQGVHVVRSIVSLITGVSVLLNFVCFI